MSNKIFTTELSPGTLIETENLIGLSIGENIVLVLFSDIFDIGKFIHLEERGSNNWLIVKNSYNSNWFGWLLSRDWNGRLSLCEFNVNDYDHWDDWDDWDYEIGNEHLDRYQDYIY